MNLVEIRQIGGRIGKTKNTIILIIQTTRQTPVILILISRTEPCIIESSTAQKPKHKGHMMTDKTVNYTPEQTATVIGLYTTGNSVEMIAEQVGKSVRSIVAKLSREGVYIPKTPAKGQGRVTKQDLINRIAKKFDIDPLAIASLEKVTMQGLETLVEKFGAWSTGEKKFWLDSSSQTLYNIIIDS